MRLPRWFRLSVILLCVACGNVQAAPTAGPLATDLPPVASAAPTNSPAATAFPPLPQSAPTVGACPVFPLDNIWNTPVDTLPLDPRSAQYIASIGPDTGMHPDFGAGQWDGGPIGIPYVVVPSNQANVTINFVEYGDESDPGPYPIPADAAREYGGDHHVLVVREGECKLYELYHAEQLSPTEWNAGSGAIYDLRSNTLRTDGWTSADAAGLPILPGLARYEEVAAGEIKHALRFTVDQTRDTYVWPARHQASDDGSLNLPPMGQRFRLKAAFDITPFSPDVQVILRALKKYGMIIADNGSDWYLSGAPNAGWNDDTLVDELGGITGDQFEAVDVSALQVDADSGQVVASAAPQDRKLANRGGAAQNQIVSYAINVVGTGSAIAVADALPAALTFVPGSLSIAPASLPAPSYSAGTTTVAWSGTLPNTQTAVIQFQASVNTSQRLAIINSATVSSNSIVHTVTATVVANGLHGWLPMLRR
jgi:hypothetical protein